MSEEQAPTPEVLTRTDPLLIIDAASLGVNAVIGGFVAFDHFKSAPPPPAPDPPQVILPPGADRD